MLKLCCFWVKIVSISCNLKISKLRGAPRLISHENHTQLLWPMCDFRVIWATAEFTVVSGPGQVAYHTMNVSKDDSSGFTITEATTPQAWRLEITSSKPVGSGTFGDVYRGRASSPSVDDQYNEMYVRYYPNAIPISSITISLPKHNSQYAVGIPSPSPPRQSSPHIHPMFQNVLSTSPQTHSGSCLQNHQELN